MKKVFVFFFVMFLLLGASGAWAEKYHSVAKGECLWLIGKKYNIRWQNIAEINNIYSPYTIYLEQKLIITESTNKKGFPWHPGSNPWKGSLEDGIAGLFFTDSVRGVLVEKIQRSEYYASASVGKDGIVRDEFGNLYRMVRMGFGKSVFKDNPIPAWSNPQCREGGWVYYEGRNYVFYPFKCGNPTRLEIISPPKKVFSPTIEKSPVVIPPTIEKTPVVMTSPPPSISPSQVKVRDNWDWYIGGGNYNNAHQGSDNNGYFGWMKLRYRPFWMDVTEKTAIGVGAFGFLAGGKGEAAKHYDYTWYEAVLGITGHLVAEHKDLDLDFGAGWLWNDGKWQGEKINRQIDDIFLSSAHANLYKRRDEGKKLLPKAEVNIEYRHPFHTEVKRGDKYDNRFVELMFTQWLYDFKKEDNSLNIAPGFNIGGGYEWGPDDHEFLKIGPAIEFSSYNDVIAGVSILNYKFQSGGQWHPIGGYVSIDGICSAIKAYRIREATAEELRHLPENGESRLLHSPADYLE